MDSSRGARRRCYLQACARRDLARLSQLLPEEPKYRCDTGRGRSLGERFGSLFWCGA
nr:MAG TPA: hypothetical protein [Caudoviricetes sp.]